MQAATGNASLVEGEGSAWWLDAHTRRLVEETLNLTGELTFTVRAGTPVRLTREQVGVPTRRPVCADSIRRHAFRVCRLQTGSSAGMGSETGALIVTSANASLAGCCVSLS